MTYYFDMDGVLANFHKEPYSFAKAINREWISNLEPFTYNVNVVRRLIAEGNKVYILSKAAKETAKQGKFDWLKKYISELPHENIIIIVGNGKKIDYIKEPGMLIDDDTKNTKPWDKAGYPTYLLENKGDAVRL